MSNVLSWQFGVQVRRWLHDDRSDRCEHVKKDTSLAYAVGCEDDSFGPVDRNVVCKPCYDEGVAWEDAQEVGCTDCKKRFRKDQTRRWRWYDFYAAQGDEPLTLCTTCWDAPKHQERMKRDDADRRAEDEDLNSDSDF